MPDRSTTGPHVAPQTQESKLHFRHRASFSSSKSGFASMLRSTAASFKDAIATTKAGSSHDAAMQEDRSEPVISNRSPIKRRISMPFRTRASSFGDAKAAVPHRADPPTAEPQQLPRATGRAPPVVPLDSGGAARRAARERKNLDIPKHSLTRRDSNLSTCRSDEDCESGVDLFLDGETNHSRQVIRKDPVQHLPTEVADHIFSFLDAKSLRKCEQVSRGWHATASDTLVWRSIFLTEYAGQKVTPKASMVGGRGIGKSKVVQQDWKAMYRARKTLAKNWSAGKASATYLHGHTDSVYCVQFDETKIITGSRDRTIRVWSMERPYRCLRVIGVPDSLETDRREQGVTHRLELPGEHSVTPERAPLQSIDPSIYHVPQYCHQASILCLQYDDEIAVTGSSDWTLIVWDIKTWEPIRRLHKHHGGVLDIALDKEKIISCSKDFDICIWDRQTGALLDCLTGHHGPVNAVQLRGNLFVSASGEGCAKLWNLKIDNGGTSRATATTTLVRDFWSDDRGLACVEFSEDAKYILAGGNDHVIYKFDTATGAVVARMQGHDLLVRSLHLDAASGRVLSGSYDLSLRVWDYNTGAELLHFPGWATSWMLSAKSDYRRIVSTSQDGRVCVVDFGRDSKKSSSVDWNILKSEGELRGPVEQTVSKAGELVIPQRKSFRTHGTSTVQGTLARAGH
ncbi:hypothetical protein FH972_022826 [Carpinus fangiana]|uniref:F-box domain-containing protein n=1 Tax=Carpinus fangiana TaxID=176857 RepID=A0A5N6KU12_9ROSI|nr:hypothetical protein FH972_022826 [Carpinus fangiana]